MCKQSELSLPGCLDSSLTTAFWCWAALPGLCSDGNAKARQPPWLPPEPRRIRGRCRFPRHGSGEVSLLLLAPAASHKPCLFVFTQGYCCKIRRFRWLLDLFYSPWASGWVLLPFPARNTQIKFTLRCLVLFFSWTQTNFSRYELPIFLTSPVHIWKRLARLPSWLLEKVFLIREAAWPSAPGSASSACLRLVGLGKQNTSDGRGGSNDCRAEQSCPVFCLFKCTAASVISWLQTAALFCQMPVGSVEWASPGSLIWPCSRSSTVLSFKDEA